MLVYYLVLGEPEEFSFLVAKLLGRPVMVDEDRIAPGPLDQADAFGNTTIHDNPDGDGRRFALNLRLPGMYYDEKSGLGYNLARDYDPKTGRYL